MCVWGEPKVNKQNFRRDRDLLCKAQQKNILHFTGNCCAFFPLSSFPRVLLISAEPEGETQSYLKLRRRFDPSSNTHTHIRKHKVARWVSCVINSLLTHHIPSSTHYIKKLIELSRTIVTGGIVSIFKCISVIFSTYVNTMQHTVRKSEKERKLCL